MTRIPRNFSCCMTRIASGMSRANARAVVYQEHIERLRLLRSSGEEALNAWPPVYAWARNGGIGVDVVLQNGPPVFCRISSGDRNLILQRGVSLQVAGVSGVNRRSHTFLSCGRESGPKMRPTCLPCSLPSLCRIVLLGQHTLHDESDIADPLFEHTHKTPSHNIDRDPTFFRSNGAHRCREKGHSRERHVIIGLL